MQDYIKGSNTKRTNTDPRQVRSQEAEPVEEERGEQGAQDDGQGAEQVGAQEPPHLRLPHGVRPSGRRHLQHTQSPTRRGRAASPPSSGPGPGKVRMEGFGEGTAFVQTLPYRGAPAPPGSGRRRGPAGGTSGAVPEAAAAVERPPWCATSVSTGLRGGVAGPARPAGPCPVRTCPRGSRAALSGAAAAGLGLVKAGREWRFPAGPCVSCRSPLCEFGLLRLWRVFMRIV